MNSFLLLVLSKLQKNPSVFHKCPMPEQRSSGIVVVRQRLNEAKSKTNPKLLSEYNRIFIDLAMKQKLTVHFPDMCHSVCSSRVYGVDVLFYSLAELIDQVTHVVQQVLNPSVNLPGEKEDCVLN